MLQLQTCIRFIRGRAGPTHDHKNFDCSLVCFLSFCMVHLTSFLVVAPHSFAFKFCGILYPTPPPTNLFPSPQRAVSIFSLYGGTKLLAIPVRHCLNQIFFSTFPRISILSFSLCLQLFPNVLTQASFLVGNQAQFAQDFSDCCCTLEKEKKRKNKKCVMIVCCSIC